MRAHFVHERSTEPMELTSTPSISNKIPLIRTFISLLDFSGANCSLSSQPTRRRLWPSRLQRVADQQRAKTLYTQVNEEAVCLVGHRPGASDNTALCQLRARAAHRIPADLFNGSRKGAQRPLRRLLGRSPEA